VSEPIQLTRQLCLDIANEIEEGFKRYRVSIRPKSDIALFINDMSWLAEHILSSPKQLTEKEIRRWLNAFLHAQQASNMAFILQRLSNTQIPKNKLEILQKRLDSLNTQGASQAPDIFFEMEIAGRLAREYPGWKISFEEPDVVMEYPDGRVGLSCKRPKSKRNLPKLINAAADQGTRAGVEYLIVVDASELLKLHWQLPFLHVSTQKNLASECKTFLAELINECSKPIADALTKGSGGVIFCARCVGLVRKPQLSLSWCLRHQSCPNLSIPGAGNAINLLVQVMEQHDFRAV